MKVRPQTELTQAQNRLVALSQGESVTRGRFGAALLQAAQGARETEGDAYSGLAPQARQALSEALEELSGKSLAQLKDLEGRPEALAALIAGLSQGSSLSSAESARLSKLLTLALPRLLQAKSKGGSEGAADPAGEGNASPARPQTFFSFLAGREHSPGSDASASGVADGASASVEDALNGANNGLAGVQGGQAYASFFSAFETPASGPGLDSGPVPAGSAPVFPVAVDNAYAFQASRQASGQAVERSASTSGAPAGVPGTGNIAASGSNSGASATPASGGPGQDSGPVPAGSVPVFPVAVDNADAFQASRQASGQAVERSASTSGAPAGVPGTGNIAASGSNSGASATPASGGPGQDSGPVPAGSVPVFPVAGDNADAFQASRQASGQAGAQSASTSGAAAGVRGTGNNAASGSNSGAAQGVRSDGADAEVPLMLDLDVQFVDPSVPLGAQSGTQVTLKGDGTWVYPESAPTQAPKTQPSQAQSPVQFQETQGAPEPQPRAALFQGGGVPESGVPVFGQTASGVALGPDFEAAPGQDDRINAVGNGAAGASDADQALEEDLSQAVETGDVPENGSRSQGTLGQSGGGFQDVSQAQASTQMLGQAPLVLSQGVPSDQGGAGGGADASARGFSGRGTSPGVGTSPSPVQNFGAALAALGQNGGQGNGGAETGQGAWPQGGPIPAGIAQTVAQALAQAGPSTPGRLLIQLSPSNLGSVLVDLSLADGKLTARLVAGQQDVRDALARDLSGFKAGLESHGVVVNEVSVALGSGMDQGQDRNPSRQGPQYPWRAFATTPSRETVETAASAGWAAYGETAGGASQGFSALA